MAREIGTRILISLFGLSFSCAFMVSGCPRQRESVPTADTRKAQNVFEFGRVRAGQDGRAYIHYHKLGGTDASDHAGADDVRLYRGATAEG